MHTVVIGSVSVHTGRQRLGAVEETKPTGKETGYSKVSFFVFVSILSHPQSQVLQRRAVPGASYQKKRAPSWRTNCETLCTLRANAGCRGDLGLVINCVCANHPVD